MSECKCSMRVKLVGDGCSICNPRYYLDILTDQLNDMKEEYPAMSTCANVTDYHRKTISHQEEIIKTQDAIIECYKSLDSQTPVGN